MSIEELEKAMRDFPDYTWKTYTQIIFETENFRDFPQISQENAREIIDDLVNRRKHIIRPTLPEK